MELEKFSRQLHLLEMLTADRFMTVDEIGKKLEMSRRSIYRYMDSFKELGFIVRKEGTKYRIDHNSPFFERLAKEISFTEDEGITLCQILNSVYNNSVQVRHLREKLARLYTPDVLAKQGVHAQQAANISTLFRAIREERVCVIKDYQSASSGAVGDRIVEPYLFLNENGEVRCYELATKMNKTFKISRMKSVQLLDIYWNNKEQHVPFYVDLFHFSGEERHWVKLSLGQLATSVLLEEYPDAEKDLVELPDGRNLLQTEVCSFLGVGRFVLGLYDDIEVFDSPEFQAFLAERIEKMSQKINKH